MGFLVLAWISIWLEFTIFRYRVLSLGLVSLAALYAGAWALRRRRPRVTITTDFRVEAVDGFWVNRLALRRGVESLLTLTILLSAACFYLGDILK